MDNGFYGYYLFHHDYNQYLQKTMINFFSIGNQTFLFFLFGLYDMYQLDPATEELTIQLKDGRFLGYAVYGNPMGYPVLYLNGFPGSRLEAKLFDKETKETDFRLIAIDRPGIGLSSYKKSRTLLGFVDDIIELVNALGFEQFGVMGISGGAPYALACAFKIPSDRLIGTTIISGVSPMEGGKKLMPFIERLGLGLAKRMPWALHIGMKAIFLPNFKTHKKATKTITKMIESLGLLDKKAFDEDPERINHLIADKYTAFIQGVKGQVQDVICFATDWGFSPKDIPESNHIYLLHGESDNVVPVEMGKYLAAQIPNCTAFFFPEGGHFSTAHDHLRDITPLVLPRYQERLGKIN
jgi:pimeloyl-ACP methyl ester carboxylesterase